MTVPQILSLCTLGGMMALFVWERFRYDVTAVLALIAAIAIGIVKPEDAFKGFSDDIVIIVGSALVISAAVQRSGLIEVLLSFVGNRVTSIRSQLLLLCSSVGIASGLIKNVGALAMLMPAALQMAKRRDTSASVFLMPMAFASLLGGLMTLVGTSPNIIVSRVREQMTGEPFRMFDYFPTGAGLLVIGIVFLRFGYRLLPRDRRAAPSMAEAIDIKGYTTQVAVDAGSTVVGQTISAFHRRHVGEVSITAIIRDGRRRGPQGGIKLRPEDQLLLSGEPEALEQVIALDKLLLEGQHRDVPQGSEKDDIEVSEAVIAASSPLIGQTAERMQLQREYGLNLIAVSREGEQLTKRLGSISLRGGDVIVLQGPAGLLPERLRELGALPLVQRQIRLGNSKRGMLPIAILAAAMIATALGLVPVAIAFFTAAGLILATGVLPLREAYDSIEWPILIMLGSLIPVADTLRSTGASNVIANELAYVGAMLPPWGAVALILVTAMAVTPFLNNAATVLVMAPIAAVFAKDLGYRPEAFLIATAMGAGCDFLTPIGHQCNTLVLGPGGYRFGDYARLGAPLSLIVVLVGTPLILATWPLR